MIKKTLISFAFIFTATVFFAKDRPVVTEINAYPGKGTVINISWKIPVNPDKEIDSFSVYRSSSPIGTYYDLSKAKLIGTVDSVTSGFTDNVKNYNDYYYAVVAVIENQPYDIILPSINSTVNGVHLKLPEKGENITKSPSAKERLIGVDELREIPLPYLNMADYTRKKPLPLSMQVKNAAKSLTGGQKKKESKQLDIYVFEEDLISPDGGDDYLLFDILKNTFIQKKYSDAAVQLESLLGTNCSLSVQRRAIFYLGESQYYYQDYAQAVRTFLRIYEIYPSLTKKWIDSSLDFLYQEN
ncbi:MAG: hypothetical protein K6F15_00425 [Treponema sp.]|nr:hypothetical protein [Treponema sp.]